MAAIVSIQDVLRQEVLDYLGGQESILVKTITDLTAFVRPGSDRVTIPNVIGYNKGDLTSGSRAAGSTRSTTASVLLLNKVKQVHDYISYVEGKQSAIDLKSAFLANAPKEYAKMIEAAIGSSLVTANKNDFDSASATAGVFSIDDIVKAKQLMDASRLPLSDRWMWVNSEGMARLSAFDEFKNSVNFLSSEELRMGVCGQIKGFKVVQQEHSGLGTGETLKVVFYHRSAVAFAPQVEMSFVEQMDETYAEEFVALRGVFGCVDCDNASNDGVRKIVMSCTTATA